jgi:hypothetical protein
MVEGMAMGGLQAAGVLVLLVPPASLLDYSLFCLI